MWEVHACKRMSIIIYLFNIHNILCFTIILMNFVEICANSTRWCDVRMRMYVLCVWCYWIKDEVLKLATYLPKINKAEQGICFDSIAPKTNRGKRVEKPKRRKRDWANKRGKSNPIVVLKDYFCTKISTMPMFWIHNVSYYVRIDGFDFFKW